MPRLNVRVSAVPVKEPRRDAQCTDPVTSSKSSADFVGVAFHVINLRELAML